jgi:hypothetical protein
LPIPVYTFNFKHKVFRDLNPRFLLIFYAPSQIKQSNLFPSVLSKENANIYSIGLSVIVHLN